jgi:hypothetical protein
VEPLRPTGFWSYAALDDASSRGRLSQLRRLLADELQQAVGRSPTVTIFQDVAAIPPGVDWERQIQQAIEAASFYIPIITPAFLQREWCSQELLKFRARERALGRQDLIFPLHFNDVSDFEKRRRSELYNPEVLTLLRQRQWTDFRDLRYTNLNSEEVARRVGSVATGVLAALYRGDGPRPPEAGDRSPRPFGTDRAAPETPVHAVGGSTGPKRLTIPIGIALVAVTVGGGVYEMWSRGAPDRLVGDVNTRPLARPVAPPPQGHKSIPLNFTVFFDWNRSSLTDSARQIISDAARGWKQQPGSPLIDILGYNDTSESNGLSVDRLDVVANELVRNGVPREQLASQAMQSGVRDPQNLRVDIKIR